MDTLLSLRVFCAVAELKSFTAAADRLGLSPAMASKHVMRLEERLATRLLNRTSRRVGLTEAGALYFEQTRQMLEGLDEVEAAVSRAAATPRGRLRLSAPVWMANPVFASLLADYRARFPQVTLEVDLSGRLVDLVDEGFDLALRVSLTPEPGLIARTIAEVPFYLVAAPAHLDRFGRPESLDESADALEGRPLLAYSLAYADGALPLGSGDRRRTVRFAPVLLSGNETLLHMAALQGMGLALLPKWLISEDLAAGRLERVGPDELRFDGRLLAVYPSRKYLSAKVRTFLDFMTEDGRLKA